MKRLLLSFTLTILAGAAYATHSVSAQEPEIKLLPDFSQVSLSDFGGIEESGSIGNEYNDLAGYDVSRQFNAGDTPDQFLKLGDLGSLAPEEFTLEDIANSSNTQVDISSTPLSEFSLVGKQTLEELVEAVPDLGNQNASDIAPIAFLLEEEGFGDASDSDLGTLLNNEDLANLQLAQIDLSEFSIDSIPNVEQAPLEDFADYQSSFVAEIPGLADVPLADYPDPITPIGTFVARIDFVWGGAESDYAPRTSKADRQRTISGSYIDGFQVPCDTNCEYLELDDLENIGRAIQSPFEGKQWIAGREHYVNGGTGCFAGGKEPTGIHPFGDVFKEVLWWTDEPTDTAEIVIFFNIKTSCGSSPYFIGPIPFPMGIVNVNDFIFVGTGG